MNEKSTKLKLCLRSAFMLSSALATDLLLKGRLRLMTGAVICVIYMLQRRGTGGTASYKIYFRFHVAVSQRTVDHNGGLLYYI